MLDKEHSKRVIAQLLREGKMSKPKPGTVAFFLQKSQEALHLSQRIFALSEDPEERITAYSWIITTAYYAIFYAATALLAHYHHKIEVEQGIHKLTYHALVYYFIVDDAKLQHHFLEEYGRLYAAAEELLQLSERKAEEFVESFRYEQEKRKMFTYELGMTAERAKALTSLERAQLFVTEVRKLIPQKPL